MNIHISDDLEGTLHDLFLFREQIHIAYHKEKTEEMTAKLNITESIICMIFMRLLRENKGT